MRNKIKYLNFILLLNIIFNNNIISMELDPDKRESNIVNIYEENLNLDFGILDMPEEILLKIIESVIELHINNLEDIFNLDKFDNSVLIEDIHNFCLTCKSFNNYKLDAIKIGQNVKSKRLQYLKNQIKAKYLGISNEELNSQLIAILVNFDINHYSITEDDLKEAVSLIISGADVNSKSNLGTTALMMASFYTVKKNSYIIYSHCFGHKGIVELILSLGSDINAKNNDNNTALMHAAFNGNRNVIQSLLDVNTVTSTKDLFNNNAFLYLFFRNPLDINTLRLLILKDVKDNITELLIYSVPPLSLAVAIISLLN